jgi:predicted nuclease of predicted toxin-antitoxin system
MGLMSADPLFIRLYLDEDFHPDLAPLLRQHGYDCESTVEAGRLAKSDEEQLEYATVQGRCLVSFNVADFAILARQWAFANRTHAGILVTPQVSRQQIGHLLHRLLQLLNSVAADEVANVFRYF